VQRTVIEDSYNDCSDLSREEEHVNRSNRERLPAITEQDQISCKFRILEAFSSF
jgi:hypothetical protein